MCPEVLPKFYKSPRPTTLPYAHWLTGERLLLVQGEDFSEDPRLVITKVLSYAKRHDWAVVAVLARRPSDPARGAARCIQIWGDTKRSWDDGPPEEILNELGLVRRRKQ